MTDLLNVLVIAAGVYVGLVLYLMVGGLVATYFMPEKPDETALGFAMVFWPFFLLGKGTIGLVRWAMSGGVRLRVWKARPRPTPPAPAGPEDGRPKTF